MANRFAERHDRKPTSAEVFSAHVDYYLVADGFPGWVVGTRGEVAQITPDDQVAQHVGGAHRQKYLSGSWASPVLCPTCRGRSLPDAAHFASVSRWRERWRGYRSPAHLYPGESANDAYVGVELIPVTGVSGTIAAGPNETFTEAQYTALNTLLDDLAGAHGFPAGWRNTSRLVGHEDVGLLDRHDSSGGWDPGALRPTPRFDWAKVGKTVWGRSN